MCTYAVHVLIYSTAICRAPDNFLKQGVADSLLEAKGIFLQNLEVFSLHSFYTKAFLEVANLVLVKGKLLRTIDHINCRHCINILVTSS